MTESTDSHHEVKTWLVSMTGKMIAVVILQKSVADRLEQVVWKGQGTVLRCVQAGVVLDLNHGRSSWWNRFLGPLHVVSRWIQKPLSVPYCDLTIARDSTSGKTWLVIDAETWKRSPAELGRGGMPKANLH